MRRCSLILSMIFVLMVFLTLTTPLFAAEPEFIDVSEVMLQISEPTDNKSTLANEQTINISEMQYLYDFGDAEVAVLYKLNPCGYAIYDPEKKIVLEYSNEYLPEFLQGNKKIYYTGTFGYYEKNTKGDYEHLVNGHVIKAEIAEKLETANFYSTNMKNEAAAFSTRATETGAGLTSSTRFYNCNTRANLPAFYPNYSTTEAFESPGVCGSTACAILMAYMDDVHSNMAGSGDFATNSKKTSNTGVSGMYGFGLVAEFVPLIEPRPTGSLFLNPGMMTYLSNHGISGGVSLSLAAVYDVVKDSILNDDIPVIVGFIDYPDNPDNVSGHYAVAVNYKTPTSGIKQVYLNTGWGYAAWVNAYTADTTWVLNLN